MDNSRMTQSEQRKLNSDIPNAWPLDEWHEFPGARMEAVLPSFRDKVIGILPKDVFTPVQSIAI